jgi:hypothetical protein
MSAWKTIGIIIIFMDKGGQSAKDISPVYLWPLDSIGNKIPKQSGKNVRDNVCNKETINILCIPEINDCPDHKEKISDIGNDKDRNERNFVVKLDFPVIF